MIADAGKDQGLPFQSWVPMGPGTRQWQLGRSLARPLPGSLDLTTDDGLFRRLLQLLDNAQVSVLPPSKSRIAGSL